MNDFHVFFIGKNLKKKFAYQVTLKNIETFPQTTHLYGCDKKLFTVLS